MLHCALASILILVSLALAACTPGSAQVAQTTLVPTTIPAHEMPAPSPASTMTATATAVAAQSPTVTPAPPTMATPIASASPSPTPTLTPTAAGTALLPTATLIPAGPAVVVQANANLRGGPGTAYPIIGAARPGQRLPVKGQAAGWWQLRLDERTGWIWGGLATPNAAADQAPEVKDVPPLTEGKAKDEA
jgi:uncharacterized protein YgiM (DUF1202 family)